jgi:hypothetical protein
MPKSVGCKESNKIGNAPWGSLQRHAEGWPISPCWNYEDQIEHMRKHRKYHALLEECNIPIKEPII